MRIEILDAAEQDLIEGFAFYELDSIFSDVESLHLYAGIHERHFGYHRLLAKRFPFAIYYRVENDTVRVYAILDCRRNPAWIRDRLA